MEQPTSVWRIAFGTVLGNFGCFVAYVLLACTAFALLSVMGGSINSIFSQIINGLGP